MMDLLVSWGTVLVGTLAQTEVSDNFWDVGNWDAKTWGAVIAGGAVVLAIIAYGGIRFWLMVTRPPKIADVHTPTIDRMNAAALDQMAGGGEETETEPEEAPADLLAAVPPEEDAPADSAPEKTNVPKA